MKIFKIMTIFKMVTIKKLFTNGESNKNSDISCNRLNEVFECIQQDEEGQEGPVAGKGLMGGPCPQRHILCVISSMDGPDNVSQKTIKLMNMLNK